MSEALPGDPRVDTAAKVGLAILQALILAAILGVWSGLRSLDKGLSTLRQQVAVLQEQQSDVKELKAELRDLEGRLREVETRRGK